MIKQIDFVSDPTGAIQTNSRSRKGLKVGTEDLASLSKKLGIDSSSIIQNSDLDRDGKLNPAEYQRGLELLKSAVADKLANNKSPEAKAALKNLLQGQGGALQQLQTLAKANERISNARVDFGEATVVSLSKNL